MKISLIICTRDRARQLQQCLDKLLLVKKSDYEVEIVIVDNGSADDTQMVIRSFREKSQLEVKVGFMDKPGLGLARNCGVRLGTGELLVFTDDDCYLEPDYFINLSKAFDPKTCQYGMGQILLFDPEDDARVANARIERISIIPPHTEIVPAGVVQGANMFFLREVFDVAGMFNESMGAGTRFPCEDIEMASRASQSGFTGAQLPGFSIFHHHGRKKDSVDADRTVASYDFGRGAYYASLLSNGSSSTWGYWGRESSGGGRLQSKAQLERLARELLGASQYMDHLLASGYEAPVRIYETSYAGRRGMMARLASWVRRKKPRGAS